EDRSHREHADPVRGPRKRGLVAPGYEYRALNARHARLRGTVEVGVQARQPEASGAKRARDVQRQGALSDATLARADRHDMTYAGKPVGNAGALFGDLLEDSGSAVAGDVVISLHVFPGGLRPAGPPYTLTRCARSLGSRRTPTRRRGS